MCRIGQNERCKVTGCEFKKAFGAACYTDELKHMKIPSYNEHVLQKAEREATGQSVVSLCLDIDIVGAKGKRRKLYNDANGICYLCGKLIKFFSQATIDHVVPKCRGGSNKMSNCKIAHANCNHAKGARFLSELNLERFKLIVNENPTHENICKRLP